MKIFRYLAIASCSAVLAAGCARTDNSGQKVVSVGVREIGATESSYTKSYNGLVSSTRFQLVLAPHSGTVTSLTGRVGHSIKSGEMFAHINAPDVNSLHSANQATLRQAQDGYARAKKVYEGGGLSELTWMDVQTKLVQAESSAEISNRSLEKCDIKAPFNGTFSEIYITEGQQLTIGERIATIIDANDLVISIDVPENEYSLVKAGSEAVVSVPSLGNTTVDAKVSDISVNTNAITHSYAVKLKMNKKPAGLMPGMICKVYLQHCKEERLIIPASIVKVDENGSYVWIVNDRNEVEKRQVGTGNFIKDGVAIVGGLDTGDRVIVQGLSKISTGMKVNPHII